MDKMIELIEENIRLLAENKALKAELAALTAGNERLKEKIDSLNWQVNREIQRQEETLDEYKSKERRRWNDQNRL